MTATPCVGRDRGRRSAALAARSTPGRPCSRLADNARMSPATSTTPRGRRPRTADADPAEDLRERVLQAAVEEFAEHGYAGGRIERISRAAGTVDRMLYYYFGNKEGLYQAALEHAYVRMVAAQRGFRMPDDPLEAMRQLVRHSWEHYANHPQVVRLLMNENLLRGRFIGRSEQVERTALPLVQTVGTILQAGQARGVFRRDVSAEHALMTIMALGFFYVANQYTCGSWLRADLMSRRRRSAWREHICGTVLASLAQPSA